MLYSDRRLDFIPCLEQRKTEYCEKSRNRSDCWCGSQYTVLCYYLRDWNRIGKYGILLLKDARFYL